MTDQAQGDVQNQEEPSTLAAPTGGSLDVWRVSVKATPFWTEKLGLWFAQIEGQLALSNILADATKYYYVLQQLDQPTMAIVEDILSNPPDNDKYAKLKAELIKRLTKSQEKKILQILTQEELGDRKPSQFLRHLKVLAPSMPNEYLRTIWSSKLPPNLQTIVASQPPSILLDDVAELADKMYDLTAGTYALVHQSVHE